jgi:phospholipase C
VLAPLAWSEHPPSPPDWGEYATEQLLNALTSNPAVWSRSVAFVTYDENGGFFDHVPPPVAPPGTPGEYLTVNPLPSAPGGIAGPIGLGFRVPLLIVSPFSRGGFVSSERFDHTSLLRFLETRFGPEVPNLSAWRRATVGDLTSTLNFAGPDTSVPSLPVVTLTDSVVVNECVPAALVSTIDENAPTVPTYPVRPNSMPSQEPGVALRPSGLVRTC